MEEITPTLHERLIKDAFLKGICPDGLIKLQQAKTFEDLYQLFIQGLDFCLDKDFPSVDMLCHHLGRYPRVYGIYANQGRISLMLNNPDKPTILLGKNDIRIRKDGYNSQPIYAKGDTTIRLAVHGATYTDIDLFRGSHLDLVAYDSAMVRINLYKGATLNIKASDNQKNVKVIKHDKETY